MAGRRWGYLLHDGGAKAMGEAVASDEGKAVLINDLLCCAVVKADDFAAIGACECDGYALQAAEEESRVGAITRVKWQVGQCERRSLRLHLSLPMGSASRST
eukprot:48676-Prymnesium_polylepis.1